MDSIKDITGDNIYVGMKFGKFTVVGKSGQRRISCGIAFANVEGTGIMAGI